MRNQNKSFVFFGDCGRWKNEIRYIQNSITCYNQNKIHNIYELIATHLSKFTPSLKYLSIFTIHTLFSTHPVFEGAVISY